MATEESLTGRCLCEAITYSFAAPPLCTHCCHCTSCQRETGSAFLINILIETPNFQITSPTSPTMVKIPTHSGMGQLVARCPICWVAIYSYYGGAGDRITFVKAGTLDIGCPDRVQPDVHIYTNTKLDWVDLTGEVKRGVKVCEEYYDKEEVWSKPSLERLKLLFAGEQ